MQNVRKFGRKPDSVCVVFAFMTASLMIFNGCSENPDNRDRLILQEDFSNGMDNWWVEGGRNVWVENERLYVDANPSEGGTEAGRVATVWNKTPISGDVRIEMKASALESRTGGNNINTFLFYSDPEGRSLIETRDERADADYGHYHDLNGYIVTFLNQRDDDGLLARTRLRRCPGFELEKETLHPMGVHTGETYEFVFTRKGNSLKLEVNGELVGEMEDSERHEEGLLGLRTYGTLLWWDDIRVYDISDY